MENAPIYKAPQDSPCCPCHGFALAKLFPQTALYLCSSTGTLQAQQTANGFRHCPKKRVDGHGHTPMQSDVVIVRQAP
jgi:hypothetical protein